MTYRFYELLFFVLFYSFIGWCLESLIYSISKREYVNAGFLTLPFILTYGISMTLFATVLPMLGDRRIWQFVYILIGASTVDRIGRFTVSKLTRVSWPDRGGLFGGTVRGIAGAVVIAIGYYYVFQMLHPLIVFILPVISLMPVRIAVIVLSVIVMADVVTTTVYCRKGSYASRKENSQSAWLSDNLTTHVWKRIEKNYPGIQTMSEENTDLVFGKGLGFDKLFWVFLITSVGGAVAEMIYVGLVDHRWMSRSSLLFGPVSLVWGIGGALLTVVLLPLSRKNDRWVFFGGFLVGGAFEYLCSVLTELVFGVVFWDYSDLPFNIGGRVNLLFLFFWGVLSVLWVKVIYPAMSGVIEQIPPLFGKAVTWVLVLALVLDAALTIMALTRYNIRRQDPAQYSRYDTYMDTQYPDDRIEHRWRNMIRVEEE